MFLKNTTLNSNIDFQLSIAFPSRSILYKFKMPAGKYKIVLTKIDTKIKEPYNQPRQKLPDVYWQNGYVDVTRYTTIFEKNSMTGDKIYPLLLDSRETIDIDNSFFQIKSFYHLVL